MTLKSIVGIVISVLLIAIALLGLAALGYALDNIAASWVTQ